MRFLHGLAVVAIGLNWAWRIEAQATTSAACITDLWTNNTQGYSPCLVASALEAACHGGLWNIPPLQPQSAYGGPMLGLSDKCQCSSVVFSMVSACGACQAGIVEPWILWIANCSQADISISSFPLPIPQGITVPAWAYLDVTIKGIWDPIAALNTHNSGAADSSAIAGTATFTGTATAAATSASVTPSGASSTSSTTSSKSGTNAGAIAGGVVGGVVGLAAVALGLFLFVRRRRRAYISPASAQFAGLEKVDLVGRSPPFAGLQDPPVMPMEPPRLYNPSDPSTFPVSPSPSLPGYTLSASPAPSAPYSQISLYSPTSAPYSSIAVPLSPSATYSQGSAHGHVIHTSQSSHGYSGVPEV